MKLSFCTACGSKVPEYEASTSSISADVQSTGEGVNHYECASCDQRRAALCPDDTGYMCRECKTINPIGSVHCASCGRTLRSITQPVPIADVAPENGA